MLFGILFAGLLESVKDHPAGFRIASYLGRLADLLADDLPFICFVLLDGVAELYRLLGVSIRLDLNQCWTMGSSYLLFPKFSIMHVLRAVSMNGYPGIPRMHVVSPCTSAS